ncbi:MAG: PAS-domain containing protein [Pseudomonadota bacterium]
MLAGFLDFLLLMAGTGAFSVAALVLWARLSPDPDQAIHEEIRRADGQCVFLFDGTTLMDCTAPARVLLADLAAGGNDLQRLFRTLSSRFRDLPHPDDVHTDGPAREFASKDPSEAMRVILESWDSYLRVTLAPLAEGEADANQGYASRAIEDVSGPSFSHGIAHSDELSVLRAVTNAAPVLLWQTDDRDEISWANETYLAQLEAREGGNRSIWPPARLFPGVHTNPPEPGTSRRGEVTYAEGEQRGFDIHCVESEQGRFYYAMPADEVIKVEETQKQFVQTLTKTFAHLSVGLVIFDKDRSLALFNPALIDLLRLPVEFLSVRPTLHAFLDRLREERLIAEPKDYKAWRQQILELEDKASSGSYCETWNLPGGVTFRVTGRPHPNGAIAFLFEDISSEMALTRRFHAEIEVGHAALDAVDEAILIVNGAGMVSHSNRAYKDMWRADPEAGVIVRRLRDVAQSWRRTGGDSATWDALIDATEQRGGPASWHGTVTSADGRTLACRAARLKGGSTLIGFRRISVRTERGVAAS